MKSSGKRPPLKTVPVGGRTLVYYDSVLQAIGIDPASEPDRPKTVTIRKTMEITSLSKPTIDRMIAAGRETAAA
ncbi:hypothetical protein AB8A28_24770 [Tardiphaga sp. 71_E8_N1_1]|uniref:hypothetical protein n=1 Tax=Tardiphaga sp. 71_E8_N1_1 TaxID=3240784 RepID=UPI003F8BE47F